MRLVSRFGLACGLSTIMSALLIALETQAASPPNIGIDLVSFFVVATLGCVFISYSFAEEAP